LRYIAERSAGATSHPQRVAVPGAVDLLPRRPPTS